MPPPYNARELAELKKTQDSYESPKISVNATDRETPSSLKTRIIVGVIIIGALSFLGNFLLVLLTTI